MRLESDQVFSPFHDLQSNYLKFYGGPAAAFKLSFPTIHFFQHQSNEYYPLSVTTTLV